MKHLEEAAAHSMMILWNCAVSNSLPSFYYDIVDWPDLLEPLLASKSNVIKFHSLLLTTAVAQGLHPKELQGSNLLETSRVGTVLKMCHEAIQSPDHILSKCKCSLSVAELVTMMIRALVGVVSTASANPLSVVEVIDPGVFLVLLGLGEVELKRAVCRLLWILASRVSHHPAEKFLGYAKCSVIKVLKELHSSRDAELWKLSKCALFYLCPSDLPTG